MSGTTPYEEIAEVVENWAKDNFYTDFIVAIRADGEELTEILTGDNGELVWLNDWWEGQKDVKLLGFRPIEMISVRGTPEAVTEGDKIRAMTDEELAKFLCATHGSCASWCPVSGDCDGDDCDRGLLDWLREDVASWTI